MIRGTYFRNVAISVLAVVILAVWFVRSVGTDDIVSALILFVLGIAKLLFTFFWVIEPPMLWLHDKFMPEEWKQKEANTKFLNSLGFDWKRP